MTDAPVAERTPEGEVVEVGVEPEPGEVVVVLPLDPLPGEVVVVLPVDPLADDEPTVSDAGLVWKLKTPTSPAAVATSTIGARFNEPTLASRSCPFVA